MSRWIDMADADLQHSANIIAKEKEISATAVEKDWWVTAILKVLFSLSLAKGEVLMVKEAGATH